VIQRLAPLSRGADENIQLFTQLRLANELVQSAGSQTAIK
jgi:hypothetical protein